MSRVAAQERGSRSNGRSNGRRAAARPAALFAGLGRLSKRDRRALILGLVILVPALLNSAVVRPYRSAVEAARRSVELQRDLLARERGLLALREQVPELIRNNIREITRLRERLLSTTDPALAEAELTAYLEGLATENNVLLKEMRAMRSQGDGPVAFTPISVEPLRVEPGAGVLDPIRVTISAESDFEGIASFLNGIDGGRLLVRVVELTLEPTRSGSRNGVARPGFGRPGAVRPGVFPPAGALPGANQSGGDQVLSLSMIVEAYAPAAETAASNLTP